jgi:GntR family transcriptional regulator, transcriptional repressor for pyruvate dehydrogenase complex
MVTSGDLKPGERLPSERELADRLQVSRNVIREASKVLEARGLVTIQTGSGVYVADVEPHTFTRSLGLYVQRAQTSVAHVFEVRWILEVETAGLAALNATTQDVAEMEIAIDEAALSIKDLDTFAAKDIHFHQLLASASHNPLLSVLLDTLADVLRDQSSRASALPGAQQNALEHHRKILRAVKSRSSMLASQAMRNHLTDGWKWIKLATVDDDEDIGVLSLVPPIPPSDVTK